MKKVLILNGHQYYDVVAKGDLTNHYIDCANKFFEENGFEVKQTHIEKGYTIQEEVEKFKWADYILFQYPVYWMSLPWIAKNILMKHLLKVYIMKVMEEAEVMHQNSMEVVV